MTLPATSATDRLEVSTPAPGRAIASTSIRSTISSATASVS